MAQMWLIAQMKVLMQWLRMCKAFLLATDIGISIFHPIPIPSGLLDPIMTLLIFWCFEIRKLETIFHHYSLVHCTEGSTIVNSFFAPRLRSWISLLFKSFRFETSMFYHVPCCQSLKNGFTGNKLSFLIWISCFWAD